MKTRTNIYLFKLDQKKEFKKVREILWVTLFHYHNSLEIDQINIDKLFQSDVLGHHFIEIGGVQEGQII